MILMVKFLSHMDITKLESDSLSPALIPEICDSVNHDFSLPDLGLWRTAEIASDDEILDWDAPATG